jgi:surface protein
MRSWIGALRRILAKVKGASLVEYGVIAGLVSVLAIAAVGKVGGKVSDQMKSVAGAIENREGETDPECYDSANTGKIGEPGWTGCEGMYIISNSKFDEIDSLGDKSYQVTGPDGLVYSIANSERNIFTGQVTDFYWSFSGNTFTGDISHLDTSRVTNMTNAFRDNTGFNSDIGGWDTSSVTVMERVFNGATAFDADIGGWDTSSVIFMKYMFRDADSFNADISGWDTSSVTTMIGVFQSADSFNVDLGDWDVSGATDMTDMFMDAVIYNHDLSGWSTDGVTSCSNIFVNTPAWSSPKPVFNNCSI